MPSGTIACHIRECPVDVLQAARDKQERKQDHLLGVQLAVEEAQALLPGYLTANGPCVVYALVAIASAPSVRQAYEGADPRQCAMREPPSRSCPSMWSWGAIRALAWPGRPLAYWCPEPFAPFGGVSLLKKKLPKAVHGSLFQFAF
eukprot:CAMPEP_0185158346 /NCGR_PEP_ID=MMETSP1139-20130426/2355_1 /TAXON_ID=298111 /ORGANISM="Pavlova sp., Strain CCMP459" /LENGTH=145 /DNA_ID=CAMNT_0027723477 /DNA_START=322 /DNA_END=759 /DNA_ORIENTATION=+